MSVTSLSGKTNVQILFNKLYSYSIYVQGVPVVTQGNGESSIPLVESVKDQHLLKPPPSMESSMCKIHNK